MPKPTRTIPHWIRAKSPSGPNFEHVNALVKGSALHTVCESADCPNRGECWNQLTATFMILGGVCTRGCRFCAVSKGCPGSPDRDEPRRVAQAVAKLGLKYAVITSVTRDDLSDGGASVFAEVITGIRSLTPECKVETLIPDCGGSYEALETVLRARPDVLNHNIETVKQCYPMVRPQAVYERSLDVLRTAKLIDPTVVTKSGLMVGVGETWEQLLAALKDLVEVGCDSVTIGQYLSPSPKHLPVDRFYEPEEFDRLKAIALETGFKQAVSGPLVRSSYHAADSYPNP
jgi:lipoyl synthase